MKEFKQFLMDWLLFAVVLLIAVGLIAIMAWGVTVVGGWFVATFGEVGNVMFLILLIVTSFSCFISFRANFNK